MLRKPSVIQSHGLVAGSVGLLWGKVFGLRTVITTHSIYEFPSSGLYYKFSRLIFTKSDKILVLSEQSKKEIESLTGRKDIIKFNYWVNLDLYKPTKNKSNKFIILFVGRLVEIKGVKVLLEAAKKWHKDIYLNIVGNGPLANLVKNSQSNNIKYLGKMNSKELIKEYNKASLLVVPSINQEGFGRVILESLACGTPVIASNIGGIPEAVDESVAKLFDPNSLEIKKVVEYYYKNQSKLNKLASNSREYVLKNYSEKNVEKIIQAFK